MPGPDAPRVLDDSDETFGQRLVEEGVLTPAQLGVAHQFGVKRQLGLRQALLHLKLASEANLKLGEVGPGQASAESNSHEIVRASGREATLPETLSTGNPAAAEPASVLIRADGDQPPDLAARERDIRNELRVIAASAAAPDLVEQIFGRAFESRATDVHFDPQETCLRVRYRIDGQLHDVLELDPALATSLVSRLKLMADLNIVERRHPQDGRIHLPYGGVERDLRIATLPTTLGEKIVIRIHEAVTREYGFDLLGLTTDQIEQLSRICAKPYGAVLVAGPVGSGKTTTLYTCLSRVNAPTSNVMTIEDPIERRLPGIIQVQVDPRIDLTFNAGLKAMLRQDPNVIMIGEIRDEDTAHIGIRAALTGVLVFSTIHAADAPSTLSNLYDFQIPGYMLSNTLLAVISQRLLRKICPYCKVFAPATDEQLTLLELDPVEHAGTQIARGEGCPACFGTGYLGRAGVFEIMEICETLRELIFQQIAKDVLRRVAVDLGMKTLLQQAIARVLEGATTIEEVFRVVPAR